MRLAPTLTPNHSGHPLLDGGAPQRVTREPEGCARLCNKVLHAGGKLGPGRQQHPGEHTAADDTTLPSPGQSECSD
jgi:hypothetical protein